MSIVDRIKALAQESGDTLASLERKLGFSNSSIRKWDKALPSAERLATVAEYFDVSTDFLLGKSDARSSMEKETDKEDETVFFHLDKKFSELSPEEQQEVEDFIDFLRNKSQ